MGGKGRNTAYKGGTPEHSKEHAVPSTSKKTEVAQPKRLVPSSNAEREVERNSDEQSDQSDEDDNVKLDYSSDDEYANEQSGSSSLSEGEYSSSGNESLDSPNSSDDDSNEAAEAPPNENAEREEELDRNDPRVRKLLAQLMKEEQDKGNVKGNGNTRRISTEQVSGKVNKITKKGVGTEVGVSTRVVVKVVHGQADPRVAPEADTGVAPEVLLTT